MYVPHSPFLLIPAPFSDCIVDFCIDEFELAPQAKAAFNINASRGLGGIACDRTRGRELGVRGWRGATIVIPFASRSTHSSATFAKRLDEGDRTEGVPTSSTIDRRIVVGWGSNEKSQLYAVHPSSAFRF